MTSAQWFLTDGSSKIQPLYRKQFYHDPQMTTGYFLDYIYDHVNVFKLLTVKLEGTKYSTFINDFVDAEVDSLFILEPTVKLHLRSIFRKLGVRKCIKAQALAIQ
ncbi:hypothetical protein [Syntrophaceticus schinkii]|uniref:Uncharacterized protein n=1 Tax=Syntrophaceticus schinkii TaxID=499207 RepID=A0A0B7MHF6_9FIRM|nr:hypothetical protein [Syntrophaceticus schinkii]CEO87386.1 hypothetical protein SSCH_1000024 [Syntrophaceticus schinkii]